MTLKIRLARGGAKKRPFYRIVVAHEQSPRDGRYIEKVGTYNPMLAKDHENRVVLKEDLIKHWLSQGAQPTERVARFLGSANIIPAPTIPDRPKKSKPKSKALNRLQEKEEKAKVVAETAKEEASKKKTSLSNPEDPPQEETSSKAEKEEKPSKE